LIGDFGDFYYPSAAATDQGVTGSSNTIKYYVDTAGIKNATIYLRHNSGAATTTYTLTTNEIIPEGIKLIPENGAIIDGAGTLTINGTIFAGRYQIFGTSITVAFGEGAVDEIFPEWWGAIADGSTDSTDAIQTGLDSSGTGGTLNNRIPVSFGVGDYLAHELDHDGQTLMIGQEVGISRIIYNGAGGADSYLIGYNVADAASWLPWGGYKNLALFGWKSGGEIAQHIWKNINLAGIDLFAKFDNVQFAYCFGDAIYQPSTASGYVNWHINRVRFDAVGGWCIHLETPASMENRPFHMEQFTVDNNISGAFLTKATSDGYYDGTHWGKGLLYVKATDGGLNISLADARVEMNKNLDTEGSYRPCLILTETTTGWISLQLSNIYGFTKPDDAALAIYAADDRTHLTYQNVIISYASALFENASGQNIPALYTYGMGSFIDDIDGAFGQNKGIRIQERQIEFKSGVSGYFNHYKSGDIIFNTAPALGSNVGWVVTAPVGGLLGSGYNVQTLSTTAECTDTSAVITLSDPNELYLFTVNLSVTLEGAGPVGADLVTSVISVDEENAQFTVDDAVSTSVDPLTIKSVFGTFSPFGVIDLQGTIAWGDLASIAVGAMQAKDVTVTGAALGDFAIASFSVDVTDLVLNAQVTAADTVTCVLLNNTAGAVDLGTGGTLYVKVIKK